MKNTYLQTIRDRSINIVKFRKASDALARILCEETLAKVSSDFMVVPILRAGLAMLPAFLETGKEIPVGILGIERTEDNSGVRAYYQKFPTVLPSKAIILDPMLATGNSAVLAVEFLEKKGYRKDNIYFTGVLASAAGLGRLATIIPRQNIVLAAVDPDLDKDNYIVPGLGDYGDRYFGTSH
jgi:uracil phosphoribosyltransferase